MYGLKDTNYVAFHIGALVFYIRIWKTQDFLSAGSDKEKVPQAYVLIMLTSGLYILNGNYSEPPLFKDEIRMT